MGVPLFSINSPLKVNESIPFAAAPADTIYPTFTTFGSSNFLPNTPSPNRSSYFSFGISCKK